MVNVACPKILPQPSSPMLLVVRADPTGKGAIVVPPQGGVPKSLTREARAVRARHARLWFVSALVGECRQCVAATR
jgi:hypothetical protein